jgi:hypothetical protein
VTAALAERGWLRLGWLLLLLILLSYPMRYLQQIALGQVVVYTGLLRLVLLAATFAYAGWIANSEPVRDQSRIIAIGYVLISLLLYNLMVANFGLFYAGYAFNLFCVPSGIVLLFYLNARYFPVRDDTAESRLVHLLLVVAIPITLFGVLQYMLNNPILHTGLSTIPRSEFGSAGQAMVRLTELAATHRIRANAIFDSAIDFGHFATLFAVLCCGMALKHRSQPARAAAYALLAGLFVIAVISTNTRNMLLYLGCCVIGCLLIYAGLGVRALVVVSLAFVGVFYASIYGVIALAPRLFAGFFDPLSLFQRARGVYVTVDQFIVNADSPMHVLFGFGYMQSVDFKFLPTTIFDNTELDIYLYAGVCGLALFLTVLLMLFNFAVRQWRETGRVAWLTVASLLVGWPLFSTINIDLDQPSFQFVFGLLVGGAAVPVVRRAVPILANRPAADRAMGLRTV